MFFEDPDRISTEEYYNPEITKIEVTIEGVPNQLYSKGMLAYQQWDEMNKYFALTSKRDKETDKVESKRERLSASVLEMEVVNTQDVRYNSQT